MRIHRADLDVGMGWYVGPWNSDLDVSVGRANKGIDEPHVHRRVTEIYLVDRGTSVLRVEQKTIELHPGEAHCFLSNSPNYLHFVGHVPGLTGAGARRDKVGVARSRLGL